MKKGLGRGLSALIPEVSEEENKEIEKEVISLKITNLEPNENQPRKVFDQEKLEALAQSIKEHGVIQPIIVKKKENGFYMIIAGERRWRAARIAGLKEIPVVIKEYDEKTITEISLIENLQREDLNPIEEAMGYERLLKDFKMTQEEISQRVGKSRPAITNTMRILNLSPAVKKLVEQLEISPGHGRALLGIEDEELQEKLAYLIIEKDLSVRQTESMVNSINEEKEKESAPKKEKKTVLNVAARELEESLSNLLETKVRVQQGRNKGKIEIEYYNKESLDRIVGLLRGR